jgi:hypothetical protein
VPQDGIQTSSKVVLLSSPFTPTSDLLSSLFVSLSLSLGLFQVVNLQKGFEHFWLTRIRVPTGNQRLSAMSLKRSLLNTSHLSRTNLNSILKNNLTTMYLHSSKYWKFVLSVVFVTKKVQDFWHCPSFGPSFFSDV